MPSLLQEFQPLFDRISAGAAERERERVLPFEQIGWLRESGFTALRVPQGSGGRGIGLRDFYELLIALAAADPNIPQALRSHVSLVEFHRASPQPQISDWFLREAGAGKIFGNGVTESGAGFSGGFRTRISDDAATVNGEKFYSTGTLYADYIAVAAGYRDEECVYGIVEANHPGVEKVDDWNGFGQRLTASGTTRFSSVPLAVPQLMRFGGASETFMTAQFQLILLACLAGVAEAATQDAAEYVAGRRRSFSHGLAPLPKDDALVQQVVGRISAKAFAAKHSVLAAVDSLEEAIEALADGEGSVEAASEALAAAELDAQQAQIVAGDLVLDATTELFEVGGASAVGRDRNLDRHWRNARTLSAHNPAIYKARSVGDFRINGTRPVFEWSVGVGAARS